MRTAVARGHGPGNQLRIAEALWKAYAALLKGVNNLIRRDNRTLVPTTRHCNRPITLPLVAAVPGLEQRGLSACGGVIRLATIAYTMSGDRSPNPF
jgi:hypothetical protein